MSDDLLEQYLAQANAPAAAPKKGRASLSPLKAAALAWTYGMSIYVVGVIVGPDAALSMFLAGVLAILAFIAAKICEGLP